MQSRHLLFALAAACTASFSLVAAPAATPPKEALAVAEHLENVFGYVAEKARPAVVVITNIQYAGPEMSMTPFGFEQFFFMNPYMRPQQPQRRGRQSRQLQPCGTGSGAVISKDGYVITNCHVIEDCEFLQVKLGDGTIYDNQKNPDDVIIVGMDKESDLAVLQLAKGKKKDFACLQFADINKLKVGQWAIAIGAPHQLEQSVTIGNVSQIGRHNMGVTTFDNYIQTDASLNPGNSGGPLLNIHGEIIGINEFIQTDGMGKGNIGLGFAIASDLAKNVADALIAHGEVKRPFLGVSMQDLTPELKKQFGTENGVIVAEAIKGEAAEKAGVQPGDIITAINGKKVNSAYELRTAVTNYNPGDAIKLDILRDDKPIQITVIAGIRDLADNSFKGKRTSASGKASATFDKLGIELGADKDSVFVKAISPDGATAQAAERMMTSLKVGDVILQVNRQTVTTVEEVKAALKHTRNNSVLFLIERQTRDGDTTRSFVSVPLD